MNIKLVTKCIVDKPKTPKDKFEFHIKFMYGDADHFEDGGFVCESAIEAMMHYELYSLGIDLGASGKDSNDIPMNTIRTIVDKYYELGCASIQLCDLDEYCTHYFEDVPYDSACDCRCGIERPFITFWDLTGVEYEVEVVIQR
tara:strand:+ start:490 stop:918 length:429 start_codon:yes stop_codon:yes gene_type:complete